MNILCKLFGHKWGEVYSYKLFPNSPYAEFDKRDCQRKGCDMALQKTKPWAVPNMEKGGGE